MRTLEHRGQKIICQYINDNFGRILAKKNIKYSILPVFSDNYIVYKCIVDGVVKYEMEDLQDSYVYITSQVPEDGWMLYITLYYMENVKHQDLKCALIIYAL